jgi:rod shape determining protein RodA
MISYFKEYFDRTTFIATMALIGIGLASIFSATFDTHAANSFYRQLTWMGFGFAAMLVTMIIPLRVIQRFAYVAFFASLSLLLLVLVMGKVVYGSKSWLGVGGMGIQPSEIVKVTTMLALASYLSRSNVNVARLKDLIKASSIVALPVMLIMLQPDFGTALTFIGMLIPVLYWAGASNFMIVIIIAPAFVAAAAVVGTTPFLLVLAALAILLYKVREDRFFAMLMFGLNTMVGVFVQVVYEKLPMYQQRRITTFLDPNNDPLGAGYNVIQAKVAIGSGGFLGKGFLHGTQTQLNFIPKQWTDFIFCVPGEEFGFVGALAVFGLFAILLFHGIKLASSAKNRFGSLIAVGFTSLFGFHMLVNIGMTMGLMPVVGIPLPFLSYGGSSLCSYMVMAGLFMNVYANRKEY